MDFILIYSFLVPILFSGMASGLIAGLFGVGGGIILVPTIVFTMEYLGIDQSIAMHIGIATSLAIIVPTSISSFLAHNKKGAVDYNIIFNLSIGVIIFTIIGSILAQKTSGNFLRLLFAIMAIISSLNMMRKTQFIFAIRMPLSKVLNFFFGGFIGFLSSMIGIGGGAISVPLMNSFSVPQHKAIGTASALGLIISLPAAITFAFADTSDLRMPKWSLGYISLTVLFVFIPLTVFASQIGAKIAHLLDELILRKIFSAFILFMASIMLYAVLT